MTQRQLVLVFVALFWGLGCSDSPQGAVPNPSGTPDSQSQGDIVDTVQLSDTVQDVEFITDQGMVNDDSHYHKF